VSALPPKADIAVAAAAERRPAPPAEGACRPIRLLRREMQSISYCHKPRFLIAVGSVFDLCVLQ
jgi:hypothetical protein